MSGTHSNQALQVLRRFGSRQWICKEYNTKLAYCDNDRYLISHYISGYSGSPSYLEVFDAETGERLPKQTSINARKYVCCGDRIFIASALSVYAATIDQLDSPLKKTFEHDIVAIEVSHDGETIAVALNDHSLFLLTPDLNVTLELNIEHSINSVHFLAASEHAPAQLAISASTNRTHRLYLLGLEKGTLTEFKGARAQVGKVVNDSEYVYAGSGKSILSWPRKGGKANTVYKSENDCELVNKYNKTCVFSNGSKHLAAIDLETGKELWQQERLPHSALAMNQDRIALYAYREVRLIDSESGEILKKAECKFSCRTITLSQSNHRASMSNFSYVLHHWPLEQGDITENTNPSRSIEHCQLLDNGDWVTLQEGQLFFWNNGQNSPVKIISSYCSKDTFFVDEQAQKVWLADEHIHCYCLKSGALLHKVPGYFNSDCRVIFPIDEERLLFISEGGRRRYGHLMVIESSTGSVLHDTKVDRAFYNGVYREDNRIYLASRGGERCVFDCESYAYAQLTDYEVNLSHGLYASHFPIQALTPKHTRMVEYGAGKGIPESDKHPCFLMVTDVDSGKEVLPRHCFSDDISVAKILPCEKRIIMAMSPSKEAEKSRAPYLQLFDIESRESSAPLVLDIEGTETARIDFLKPLNNQEALVGFNNGTNVLVGFS